MVQENSLPKTVEKNEVIIISFEPSGHFIVVLLYINGYLLPIILAHLREGKGPL